MVTNTISCFTSLIYLENFFSINRTYIITTDRTKLLFWNVISMFVFSIIFFTNVYDIYNSTNIDIYTIIFQAVMATEFLVLIFAARYRNVAFKAFKRLDEKCGINKKTINILEKNIKTQTILSVMSIAIDAIGMYSLGAKTVSMFTYLVMFASHEAETMLFALIIEAMNLRLATLKDASLITGSRVYRHILIASDQMNEEFTPRILLMLAVVLVTSISYSCAIMLMPNQGVKLAVYLVWRELRSMYCTWKLCMASSQSETLCRRLTFQLARRLAFDNNLDKSKHPLEYSTALRWYRALLRQRPRYVRGSVISIGLGVPLHLIDITINYVLIIIQIYAAYK